MGNNSVIKVEGLSKHYLLNKEVAPKSDTLYGTFISNLKNIKSLTQKKETIDFWALNDVSFDIQQGDRVGIIGRNGAGKSTLLKILSRITPPTKGRIEITGRVASLLEVGTGFHGDLSGRENIYLNGSILGMSKHEIDRKFDEIVEFAEIGNFLDTPVKRYSSGMYVRLAFAVAAHLDPDILIVDEVLAVGDAAFQKKCIGKMNDISKEGSRTILFVSHSMQAVQKLCNKGIYLQKGQLIAQDNIDAIINLYLQSGIENKAQFELPKPTELSFGFAHKAYIEDMQGNELQEIPVGAPWRVCVQFNIEKFTPHFIMGMGIVSSLDLPIRTSWSAPTDMEIGHYELIFDHDDLMLTTGNYKLVIGLSSNQRAFQYDDSTVTISISDVGEVAFNQRIVNTQSGLILNPMNVVLHKLN